MRDVRVGRRQLDPVVTAMVVAVVGVSTGVFGLAFTVNAGPRDAAPRAAASHPAVAARPTAELAAQVVPVAPPAPVVAPSGSTTANPARCTAFVALTFDDGPSPTYTNPLLDYLSAAKVPATFFVQGSRLQKDPAPTQRAAALGFTIGNHTWDHRRLTDLTDDVVVAEVARTQQVLSTLGILDGTLFRSPYGADNPHIVDLIKAAGLTPVGWTIDSRDYADGTPAEIAQRVLAGLQPHVFNQVLVHDGIDEQQPNGRIASAETLPAVPLIVDAARAAGYCFTQFGLDGHPMIPAPTWGPHGWVATPHRQR